jgi:PST family polysaccharide transporter
MRAGNRVGMMDSLRERTLSGLGWSGASQLGRQLFCFAVSVVLARTLSPREFGLMGMIVVFTGFADLFGELGFGSAIIQKQDLQPRHLNSVFWVNVASGLVLTAVFITASSWMAAFYGEPLLGPLTRVVALNFLLGSLAIVQRKMLVKSMDFRRLFLVEIVAIALSGLVAIAAALSGLGVWSLVAQSLVLTAVSVVMLWSFSTWRPAFRVDIGAIRELFAYSANLLGFNVLNYWTRNLDNVLIGRFIGSAPLGIYARAYGLMLLPIGQVTSVLTGVMFPAMSVIQGDLEKVKRVYLRATRSIALVTFPLVIGLLVVADSFVRTIYGDRWSAAVPVVRILCLIGVIHSVGTTMGWIYNSQGRTDIQLRWGLYVFVVKTIAFLIGLRWGITGVAAAYTVSSYLLWYPNWTMAGRLIHLRFGEMVRNLAEPFFCAVAMAAAVWALWLLLPADWPPWLDLAVQASFGALVYVTLCRLWRVKAYLEIRELVRERIEARARLAPAHAPYA